MKASHFLGSRLLFGALLNRCQARGLAALCYLKRTVINKPRIVALLPSSQDDPGLSGFHVIHLPFKNEIRPLDYEKLTARIGQGDDSKPLRAAPDQVEAAKKIVKKLKWVYDPENFEDPTLHTWWTCIEATALEKPGAVEPADDTTLPDDEGIVKRLGNLTNDFSGLVYPDGYDHEPAAAKVKASVDPGEVEHAANTGTVN